MLPPLALALVLLQEPPAPPPPPPEARTRVMFLGSDGPGRQDKDGDGQVARDEFTAPLNEAFDRLDKDGYGRLSTSELTADPHAGGPHVTRRIEFRPAHAVRGERLDLIDDAGWDEAGESRIEVRRFGGRDQPSLDGDGDGRVSEAEFTAPLREAFARMDADRSGFIEEGERGDEGEVRILSRRVETRRDGED